MKALTYLERGKFALLDKTRPVILNPRAISGITAGHEMVSAVAP